MSPALATVAVWCFATPAGGETLTATQVIAEARAHRAELTAARARADAAENVPGMVGALPEPMVMGGIDHVPFTFMGASWSVQVQQDFPLSGLLGARARVARAAAQSERAKVGTAQLDVEAAALRSFLMLAELQGMERVLTSLRDLADGVLSSARARLVGAQGVAADVVRAEANLARQDAELSAISHEIEGAAAMLAASIGRAVSGAVPVPRCALDVPTAAPSPQEALVGRGLEARPELPAMRARVNAARARVDEARAMYWPMAFVRAGAASTMSDGPGAMLMVGLSVPLWREKLRSGVGEAEAMVAMESAEVEAMRVMVAGDVAAARSRVEARRARFLAVRDSVGPRTKDAANVTRDAYVSGQVPLVSVLDAYRDLAEAEMQQVQAEVQLAQAWAELGRALGTVEVKPW